MNDAYRRGLARALLWAIDHYATVMKLQQKRLGKITPREFDRLMIWTEKAAIRVMDTAEKLARDWPAEPHVLVEIAMSRPDDLFLNGARHAQILIDWLDAQIAVDRPAGFPLPPTIKLNAFLPVEGLATLFKVPARRRATFRQRLHRLRSRFPFDRSLWREDADKTGGAFLFASGDARVAAAANLSRPVTP
ncbi:MAG TPA: hypothetical protein VF624_01375 [Tepidisphaeraceae bacterium]